MSFAAKGAELLIRGYQCISRHTPPVCRFRPTCSEYTRQAIVKYGFWRGSFMGAWRILRCNPFNNGDPYDPVP
ncbi:MAG: membrane protein insertion efficiency factor YidD [bacterium]|nr:membrane protein insertion efficiency factor YidD [bacterium]